ncbi:CbiX/SirB N-terminal domain-containing protein, partial [Kitasatospora nipponensis]|uniref:sirohydrochlorin chelatase n=1 Tax=Kitasatospora nipponensis TaxID=258049 RepID=UPI0031DBBAED
MTTLVLIAHGSRDPRHAATVDALVHEIRAQRPELAVATAYLDHCAPRVAQVAGALADRPAVAVPLLLNRAFHAKHDIPAALRAAGLRTTGADAELPVADVLGPDPLLLAALDRRLAQAGPDLASRAARAATGVVLAGARPSPPGRI